MTALEQYQEPMSGVDRTDVAIQRLAEWAQSAQAAAAVASELVRTSFVPDAFKGKPQEATAAILAGLEVGLAPMASLRSFDVIQGQAAPRAITLRAIIQSQGHELELVESTGTRCKMRGRRRGASAWQEVTWTLDRAKQLKLAGKPNWQNQPQAMLVARATSEIARLIASDAILGIAYSSEEIADGAGAGVEVPAVTAADPGPVSAAASGTRRMSRKQSAAAPPAELVEETGVEVLDADVVEPPMGNLITDAQIRKMAATFRDFGITGRDDRLAYIADVVGHNVTSSKELTKDEASTVIDALTTAIEDLPERDDPGDDVEQLDLDGDESADT